MAEFYQPELKVSALRERAGQAALAKEAGAGAGDAPQTVNLLPPIALQPAFTPRERNAGYHVSELLQFHDEAFIKNAYRALVGREPDRAGADGYLAALRSGRINRLDVLARLRFSAEGMRRGVPLAGARGPAILRRAYRVPFLGPALRWAVSLARLPRLVRHVNQLESHLVAQQEQIASYANELNRRHSERQADNIKRLDDLAAQQQELEHWRKTATATYAEMAQVSLTQFAEEFNGALSRLSAAQQEAAVTLGQQLSAHGTELTQQRDELVQQRDELAAQAQTQQEAARNLQRQLAAQETFIKRQREDLISQAQMRQEADDTRFSQLAQRLELQKAAFAEQLANGQAVLTEQFANGQAALAEQLANGQTTLTQEFTAYRQEAAQQVLAQQQEVARLAVALAQARVSVREELQAQTVAATQTLAAQLQQTTREETKAREQFAQTEMAARENFVKAEMAARENFVKAEITAREAFSQTEAEARAQLAESVAGLAAQLSAQEQEFAARAEAQERLAAGLRAEALRADAQAQAIRAELVLQSGRVERLFNLGRQRLPDAPFKPAESAQLVAEAQHTLDAFYVALEDRLRGNRETILERLGVYLPFLRDNGLGGAARPVLDLGCGRGEWLELMRQEGFTASGVDTNRILAEQCRALDLQVAEADILAHLRDLPDESQGVVTCFHVVEHLPLESVLQMLSEVLRVLQPGGLVIFETPNPRNVLVGSCNFYYDPTHRNPVPSPVLQFMLEARGFARVEVLNLNPSDAQPVAGDTDIARRFNEYFYGPMDYAVIGRKP
jgi:O-antigen chain-terminating methyltransferase